MCEWEEFIFLCGHSVNRRRSYCHQARNQPRHRCARVHFLRCSWLQPRPCDKCAAGVGAESVVMGRVP